jgi:hypothetical protein
MLFGTNVLLSVRHGQSLFTPNAGGVLTEPQFGLPLRALEQRPRFTLNLLPNYALPASEVLPATSNADNGVEWAERVNAEGMHRYREEWEKFLTAPHSQPVPVLYGPKIQIPEAPSSK